MVGFRSGEREHGRHISRLEVRVVLDDLIGRHARREQGEHVRDTHARTPDRGAAMGDIAIEGDPLQAVHAVDDSERQARPRRSTPCIARAASVIEVVSDGYAAKTRPS